MDWGIVVISLIALGIPTVIFGGALLKARKEQKAHLAYQAALNDLRGNPTSPQLRERALQLGRRCIELRRLHGGRRDMSELSLSNDISAACSYAINRPGAMAKVEVVNAAALGGSTVASQIEQLGKLCAAGVISNEEFERGKQLFLGGAPDKAAVAISLLQSLAALKETGVLSPSEFNMKKWEILSERLIPGRFEAAK